MLIRRIEFSGIGPFAGHHSINMDQLTAQNVFLIEGPTGAGKSSIIDAIVFALYGSVAGKESSDKRMRSSHASLTEESWVDLVFTIASGTYRVRRSPAQSIAKKRGKGTRELAQSASLWRISEAAVDVQEWESGEPLATGARESSQIIRDIVGMSKDQFVQTVVLPQGQFADFLRLNSKDRSALLEKIFHTAGYRDVMDDVKARAKEADIQIKEAFNHYSSAFDVWLNNDGISDAAREALQEARTQALSSSIPDHSDIDANLLSLIQRSCASLSAESAQADKDLSIAQENEHQAQTALEEGKYLSQILHKRADLLDSYQDLIERKADIDTLIARIDQHNKAELPLLRHNDVLKTAEALEAALEATPEDHADTALVGKKLQHFDTRINEVGELLGQMRSLLEQEKELATKKEKYRELHHDLQELEKTAAALNKRLAEFPKQISSLAKKRQETLIRAQEEKNLAFELEKITHLTDVAQQHKHAAQQLSEAEEALRTAIEEQQVAKTKFDLVTAQWVASAAANLAEQLTDNSECPVCGSTSHPAPAKPAETYTDRTRVDDAQNLLNTAHSVLSQAQAHHLSTQRNLEALASELADHTLESLEARSCELNTAIEKAQTVGKELDSLDEEIENLQHQHTNDQESLAKQRESSASISSTLSEHETAISEYETAIAEARDDFASIADKYAFLSSQRDELYRQRDAYQALSATLEKHNIAAQKADEALDNSPFTSLDEAQEAHIAPDVLAQYRSDIDTYTNKLSGIKAQLEAPEIAQLTGEESVDIEQLTRDFDVQKAECEQAQKKATLSQQYASAAQRAMIGVIEASAQWHHTADSARAVARLANIASAGDMSLSNIPLNIWVLLKRFEIVVARANEHLSHISGGRYELKRVDESSGNRKAGLDLRIIDREGSERGDEERDTSSLSGGETFYTSLALALALAEVVQEEQGGIRIDTLLIDEGFGTLSDDVREAVMHTLTSLSAHGRVVGIVSHIDELKKMVPNRITVQRTPQGSSTLSVTA